MVLYSSNYSGDKRVVWVSPDAYLEKVKEAYNLLEEGFFQKTIEVLNDSLRLNPVGVAARFEKCEAYLKMGDLEAAEKNLLDIQNFLYENALIARFYRRYGYIQTEKNKLKEAAACYNYSLRFQKDSSAIQELLYITSIGGKNVLNGDQVKTLNRAGIPIIKCNG